MEHPANSEEYKGLTVNKGIEQPSIVNPYLKLQMCIRDRNINECHRFKDHLSSAAGWYVGTGGGRCSERTACF